MAKRTGTYKTTHALVARKPGPMKVDFGHSEVKKYTFTTTSGAVLVGTKRVFVKDGERFGQLELWINMEGLLRLLGPDALYSKSRAAKRCNGLVQVRAVNVSEVKA